MWDFFSAKVLIFMPAGILHPTLAFQSEGSTNDDDDFKEKMKPEALKAFCLKSIWN